MSRIIKILEQLNTLDEHSSLEAKSGLGNPVQETICAFANEPGLGGGTIVLGVQLNDKRTKPVYEVVGVEAPDKVSSDLASQCASVFNVVIRPRITTEQFEGKNVLIVEVNECEAGQKPVFIKRKGIHSGAFRRIGSTNQLCTDDDIALLYGSRNPQPFDQTVWADATYDDLDPEAIEYYRTLRRRVNPSAEELNYSDEELLQALRAVDSSLRPTLTGILLFGKKLSLRRLLPSVRIDYIRVPGTQWIDDPHNRFTSVDMRGSLLQLVRRAQDSAYEDLPRKFHLEEGEVQAAGQGIPADVIREAIVNAVMHASYRVHRPIQIIRYADRLEICNPGYSLKREDTLGQPGSDLRNPSLAAVFHETNLAETKGTGIRTIRKLLKEAGFAPPLFQSDRVNNLFTSTFSFQHFSETDDQEPNNEKLDGESTKLLTKSTKLPRKCTKLPPKSTKFKEGSAELDDKIELLSDELQSRIRSLRKKESSDVVQSLIEAICHEATMSAEELAILLDRNPKALYREHIRALVQENRLFQVNPSNKTDPNQAYTSRKE